MNQIRATVLVSVASATFFAATLVEAAQWTGGGATTDWTNVGNWANGQLPGATSVVELTGDASISLTGDGAASCIVNVSDSPVTLTLTANADVRLAASICGDIAVEKRGAGRLLLAARQSYSGGTHVVEGTLTTSPDLSYADYKSYGTLSVHLDASHPETLVTDAAGDLVEWKSLTDNGITTYGAETAYPSATHGHASPSVIADWWGRPAVRFGETHGATDRACTFISASNGGASAQFKARTFFLVQRQRIETSADAGLLGMIKGASFRFYRDGGATFRWSTANMGESWNNGRKATGLADNRFELSGTTNLNLLVVRNAALGTFDIIGTQFLVRDNETLTGNNSASLQMDFYEVLLFDEALTDAQIDEISAVLMQKWNIPQQVQPKLAFDGAIAPASRFVVSGDVALDFAGSSPTILSLEFDATGMASVPILRVAGDWDVTDIPLRMTGFPGNMRGYFLNTSGRLTSPFASLSGCDSGRIVYAAYGARIRAVGLYMVVR